MSVERGNIRSGLVARGVVGGIVAGGLFLAATMWFATSVGDPAKAPLLMMSTIVKGDDAMMAGTASVGIGLAVHLVLSAGFGVVFAVIASRLRTAGNLAAAGVAYGAALYLVNFKVLSPTLFTTFEMANQPFELVVHVVFGVLLALAFVLVRARPRQGGTAERRAHRSPGAGGGVGLGLPRTVGLPQRWCPSPDPAYPEPVSLVLPLVPIHRTTLSEAR